MSLAFNIGSTLLKAVAAVLTGSVSLLSEAAHSGTDVVASLIAFISVRAAAAPPDEEHPYGHGKIESLAGFGESVLLLFIVLYVLFEAIQRLTTVHAGLERVDVGLAVMAICAIGSAGTGLYVKRVASHTRSMALTSNGQHLMVDAVTCLGVLLALAVTRLTGWQHADAVFALGFAAWLGWSAWGMLKRAFEELIDRRLPDGELERIRDSVEKEPGLISFHRLRTRLSGSLRYIDMHVVVPREWSLVQAHNLADSLEKRLEKEFEPAQVVIHVDPFDLAKSSHPPQRETSIRKPKKS